MPPASSHPADLAHAVRRGIEVLSIFAFSRENWARGETEVQTLFGLLDAAIRDETPDLVPRACASG